VCGTSFLLMPGLRVPNVTRRRAECRTVSRCARCLTNHHHGPLALTRRSLARLSALVALVIAAGAYRACNSGRVDTTALGTDANGPRLRVVIMGDPADPRIPAAREAIAYWNREFLRVGRRVHFDSVTVRGESIPDDLLRAASGEAVRGGGPATTRLHGALSDVPGDIVIALSRTDLISFSVRWRAESRGVAGIRRSDIPPLSLPNTVRNVVAHEIGHVLGLAHNGDPTTLMCGRPAACRPAAFASDSPRFFPLTAADERRLRARWP
jgi:Matrixin